MTRENHFRTLAVRVGIGVAAALVLIVVDSVLSLRVDPVTALFAGVGVAVATWVFTHLRGPAVITDWEQPMWRTRSPRFHADIRTRRLASVLSHSQPGQAFDASALAKYMADLTARRLVATGRVAAEDPLAHAEAHLSPALRTYLASAATERPQVLNRKTLHAHLKEIDSL